MSQPPEEDLNYFWEQVRHPVNFWALCGGLILGSVGAIATGVAPVLLIPAVAQAGINGILGLFLPESPVFRGAISRGKRFQRREQDRLRLEDAIRDRVPGEHANWARYRRLRNQLGEVDDAARRVASFSFYDVERLDDTTVDFLRLWLARILLHDRAQATDEARIRRQLDEVEHRLLTPDLAPADARQLRGAAADLKRVLERHRRRELQDHAMAASMLAMVDGFSEMHQRVLAAPTGEDLGGFLDDQLERLAVNEELDHLAAAELEAAVALSRGARRAAEQELGELEPRAAQSRRPRQRQ